MSEHKENISFNEFKKINLQIGKITSAENLEGYNKILKVLVDIGNEKREILSGIARHYDTNELIGKYVVICTNLEPKKIGNSISNGMLLAAEKDGKPILLTVNEEVDPGSAIS